MHVSRRSLLAGAPAILGLTAPFSLAAQERSQPRRPSEPCDAFPSQDPLLVREMVGAAHMKLDRVRELVAKHPALAKAAWDWGFGDWETAIGAASHTGRRDIVKVLMEHGARPDLFTFAMLGQLDAVKAYVAANPGIQRMPGPHGISLLRHARAGGEQAAAVAGYLSELGDADPEQRSLPLSDELKQAYAGEYTIGDRSDDRLIVARMKSGEISIQRGRDGTPRQLYHQGEHAFHPAGAAAVRLVFEMQGAAAKSVRVIDGDREISAARSSV